MVQPTLKLGLLEEGAAGVGSKPRSRRNSEDIRNRKPGKKDSLAARRHSMVEPTTPSKGRNGRVVKVMDRGSKVKGKGARSVEDRKSRKEILLRVNEERKDVLKLKKDIFGLEWLDKCTEKVVYPNEACAELMERVGKALSQRVIPPQDSDQKQQALFYLLGPDYTEQYFPTHTYSVHLLEPPKMQPERKKKYLEEMTQFLKKALDKAMKDCNFPADYTAHAVDDELFRFLQDARQIYRDGLEVEVIIEEEKRGGADEDRWTARGEEDEGGDGDTAAAGEKLKVMVTGGGVRTEVAGRAVVTILGADPDKKKDLLKSLTTKRIALPSSLRQFVWDDFLTSRDKTAPKPKPGLDGKKEMLKNFKDGLAKQVKSQNLSRATRSKNGSTIDGAVIEIYDSSPVLRPLDVDDTTMRTARTLNTFDVYTSQFSPAHVYWLLPVQTVYTADEDQGSLSILHAHRLVQLHGAVFPKPDALFAMADKVMALLNDQDSVYHGHIKSSLSHQTNKIDVTHFPPEVLDKSPAAAAKLHAELMEAGTTDLQGNQLALFTDPAIFIRKWIVQGFMGVLSLGAGLWVWDQLMLNTWSQELQVQLTLAILALIRPWMMRASKYSGAKKVLLCEPSKIYLSDLRNVLKHLQTGGRLVEAPPTNNYIGPPSTPAIQVLDEYGQRTQAREDEGRSKGRSQRSRDQSSSKDAKKDVGDETTSRGKRGDSDRYNNDSNGDGTNKEGSDASSREPRENRSRVSVLPFSPESLFDLQLKSQIFEDDDIDDYEPLPIPEPPPDSDTDQEDEAEADGAKAEEEDDEPYVPPPPYKPPPDKGETWLPHDPSTLDTLPKKPCRISDAADLYIDEIRFLPDCVTLCKVTGRVYNIHLDDNVKPPEILTYPQLHGPQKCPTFGYRVTLNSDRQFLNPDLVILLTVHGHQQVVRNVAALGSCLVPMFNSALAEPLLRVGAYQLRLRHGRPKPEGGMANLKASDMDDNKAIPALTLLIRILPHTKEYVPPPAYDTGIYQSDDCEPTKSEANLIRHYRKHPEYSTLTVQDKVEFMLAGEGKEEADPRKLQEYLKKKVVATKPRPGTLPPATDFSHFTEYDIARGLKVDIQGVFNLPDSVSEYYILAYGEVIDGEQALEEQEKEEMEKQAIIEAKRNEDTDYEFVEEYPEGEQRLMTSRPDMKSATRSPQWLDEDVKSLHPHMSSTSVLIVRLFGIRVAYTPSGTGLSPGKITHPDGSPISLSYKTPLCWGVVQLFAKGTVLAGSHFVPLFQGGPPPMVVAMFRREHTTKVLEKSLQKQYIKFMSGASLETRLWDGKIEEFNDLPETWHKHLIKALKVEDKVMRGREEIFDKKYEQFILPQMKGADRFDLQKVLVEGEFFRQAANVEFSKAMNEALVQAGKEPMPPLPVFVED